ncbi:extracellular solute-binding protein [Deinococcus marmoris]|uniref:Sugar binding protein, ABC transport system n=1 Tax=Deinococcus marmoris TaxID=249408 RepID=A0A1U7NUV6_9DEIO|nr:extracellular solute-binding protein [Deinococcus marmoris]OLV16699.1 sugar binding protein, ABC transport system precursor [Deinococcus marmoris]
MKRSQLPSARAAALLSLALAGTAFAQTAPLKVWTRSNGPAQDTYLAIGKAYQAKTGQAVEFTFAFSDFEQRLARAIASGDLPDVVVNDTAQLGNLLGLGVLAQVDRNKVAGNKDIVDRAWKSAQGLDGKYYGVPSSTQVFELFIRKDWRTKLRLPLPRTWEDVTRMAQAFTTKDPDGNGKNDTYGFIIPGSTTRGYASWFVSSFIWQAGGDFVQPAANGTFKATLDTPQVATALKYVRSFICNKTAQPNAINAVTADATPGFYTGQAGMYFTGPYNIGLFDKELGKDKYDVVAFPKGPANADALAEGENSYIMKASKQPQNALAFAAFLASPEGQKIGMTFNQDGQVIRLPINRKVDAAAVRGGDARWKTVQALYNKSGHAVPNVPNWAPIRALTGDGFNRILARCDSNVEQELSALNTQLKAELTTQKVLAK